MSVIFSNEIIYLFIKGFNDNDQKFIQTKDRMKYPKSVAKGNESAAGELGYSIFIKSFF